MEVAMRPSEPSVAEELRARTSPSLPVRRMTRSRFSAFTKVTLAAGVAAAFSASAEAQPAVDPAAQAVDPFLPGEDESFLLTEPTTPEEYFRAAVLAQRIARPNLARGYLQGFLASNPDDELLLRLRDEYGPGVISRLANQPELQPLSTQLADRIAEVFRRRGADPARIEALIDALGRREAEAAPAREALINAGDAVIPQILLRLRGADEVTTRQLLDALAGMREAALPALHAALESPDDGLKVQVLSVIGRIGSRRSVPHLYFPAYADDQPVTVRTAARAALAEVARTGRLGSDVTDPADVAGRLADAAVALLSEPLPPADAAAEPAAGIRVWTWDAAAGTARFAELDERGADLAEGTRFARQAFRLAPSRPETQSLYLAFLLGSEAYQAKAAVPPAGPGTAFNAALAAGPTTAEDVLRQALRYNIPRAGVAALAVIAQTGAAASLFESDSAVVAALDAADPRVQLAAAAAVLSLGPDRPFPHSGRVVEILARTLSDSPDATAVIIDPSVQRGSTLAGFVRDLGYQVAFARSGQQGFATAARQVRPAFVLVNLNVSQWPLSQTLANFRADARTREVPIVVYGPSSREWLERPVVGSSRSILLNGPGGTNDPRQAVLRQLSDVPGTSYVIETTTSAAFAAQMEPVLAELVTDPLTPSERAEARAVAAFRLAQIADTGRTDLFPLEPAEPALTAALTDPAPGLAENALMALSGVPTETAQLAIANFVLTPASDAGPRIAAANALTGHVRRFGLLIPKRTVAELKEAWEKEADPELRTALAAWGGSLRPGGERVRYQLESYVPLGGIQAP